LARSLNSPTVIGLHILGQANAFGNGYSAPPRSQGRPPPVGRGAGTDIVTDRLRQANSAILFRATPMYFQDFYHHHPHGVPIGGLIVVLLVVIIVVLLTRNSKS
jgi:hypothetical protein